VFQIKHIEPFPSFYYKDFYDKENTKTKCTGIRSGKVVLFNNVENIENLYKDQYFQTHICTDDGIYGCAIGNWIALRKHNDYYIFIPLFERFNAKPDGMPVGKDAEPPSYIKENGIVWFDENIYTQFKDLIPAFNELSSVKEISAKEIIEVWQSECNLQAFGNIFGIENIPDPEISCNLSDTDNYVNKINRERQLIEECRKFSLERISAEDKEVNFTVQDSANSFYKPSVLCDNKLHLRIDSFKVVRI